MYILGIREAEAFLFSKKEEVMMGCLNILSGYSTNSSQKISDGLNILVVNLMPNRVETEQQIVNLVKATNQNINLTFCRMATHQIKHFDPTFTQKYVTTKEVYNQSFDAMIVTGAPVDNLDFQDVDYFNEFKELLDWRKTHVSTCIFSCWSAWAAGTIDGALHGHHVKNKIYGVYNTNNITMPHSRFFKVPLDEVNAELVAGNEEIGATVVFNEKYDSYYVTGHLEYATDTLSNEYFRDVHKGLHPKQPVDYFDPDLHPTNHWRQSAIKFYQHWLNQPVLTK